jgi:hypothetical protein
MKKYQFMIVSRKPKPLIKTDSDIDSLKVIEELAKKLSGIKTKWYLVGGFGIDLHYGSITRKHFDIDIEIDKKDTPQFMKEIQPLGYGIYTQSVGIEILPKTYLEVYRPSKPEECTPEKHSRIRMISNTETCQLTKCIDIKFCENTPNGTRIGNDGRPPILIREKYDGPIQRIGDQIIRLRNIEHHRILKANQIGKVHFHDNKTIDTVMQYLQP